jgi:outer membrane beta-barrel protein
MESRIRSIFLRAMQTLLVGMASLLSHTLLAQEPVSTQGEQVIVPELERRTIQEPKIDTEDFEVGVYAGALSVEDFGVNPVYGARLAYHVTEDIFTELTVGTTKTSKTSFELLNGSIQLLTDDERNFTYYDIGLGYNLFTGESFFGKRAFNSDVYALGGIGNTHFAGDDHFTWSIGAGYRFLPNDWLAIDIRVKDHIFSSDILGVNKTTHNIEVVGGLSIFF